MSSDAIPHKDSDFDAFQKQFVSSVAASPAKYGLAAADVATLVADQAAWAAAYPTHLTAHGAALAASKAKDAARAKLVRDARASIHKMNGTLGVDNAARVALGLPPKDLVRSRVAPPASRPIGRLEAKGHATLVLHFADETTPKRAAKPRGVHGCEIWIHVGDPAPADPSAFAFLTLDTRTPYTDVHAAGDAGKSVYYLFRWQNAKGETGPWSDIVAGKIPV